MSNFYKLTVKTIQHNTPNSVVITFDLPRELKNTFKFLPGQYLTIEKQLNGVTLRRAYSICSDPTSRELSIGVKRMDEGSFSKYANEVLQEGDELMVHPPQGRFVYKPVNTGDTIMAFAAGSGITPIMSILKAVIYKTNNPFVLVYGNKSIEETMFYDELMDLATKFANRIKIHFVFSKQQEANALYGRIESSTVATLLSESYQKDDLEGFYICGPEAMTETIHGALEENGIDTHKIHKELFTTDPMTPVSETSVQEGDCKVTVTVDDDTSTLIMQKKERVLTAVLKNGIDAPYSCQGGICSSCIARVTEGKVTMVKNQILTDEEIEEGLVLTCQSIPETDTLVIDYDDV
ncbi:ferredoxin--NADP reductase [Neptunitalea lumnitzerae]|uniref:Flavodoxin reductase n=1 Tax=Neptunitalea lumnitzerae TaxID=2965509 RepID=A0ABQ5MFE6_9FLAO|nr:ferredoxin--NADP reductase [Neptunitalea sp. Y10]GLB48122.1 flavodoxin reductase [Neptunitalea sp. Y10]